ncbi:hypothetical protein NP233_g10087 [Leucocoprinus birnbaumii]|uniref:Protein kinase domain-containing protein n=1 Tax=Leucocoprinus birnbaumii TaxID=56174 RepID=A0AAD5VJ72_9AGAR|nr:hypothetical protein NP233_g10087 [Leucocoprinus birnbaumii]
MAERESIPSGPNEPTDCDIFVTLNHLVSQIDTESRVDEVVDNARGLTPEDTQLLVNCLSTAIDRGAAPPKTRPYVWRSLIKIASSARIFAQDHTLNPECLVSEKDSADPGIYSISDDASSGLYCETFMNWVHLSHPNILSLYAVFLGGSNQPTVVFPSMINQDLRDFLKTNRKTSRMALIYDVVSGLSHLHQFDIVHGSLNPNSVLVSCDEKAIIADLYPSSQQAIRYSAPELMADEGALSKAADIWALACLIYEVLSGKIPYSHIAMEFRVVAAVVTGSKPNRPGKGDTSDSDIGDAIWQVMLMCWELKPEDRARCLTIKQILRGIMVTEDICPSPTPIVPSGALIGFRFDHEEMKSHLTHVLGSEHLPSLRVPEHLRKLVSTFVPDTARLKSAASAAKRLDPSDLQIYVDFLDLVLDDVTDSINDPITIMLSSIMVSTHVIPHRYKIDAMQYDSTPIFKGINVVAFKAHGLNVRVNHVVDSWAVKAILQSLSDWVRLSHPNLIPYYGVFHEGATQSPRLCVVTPLYSKGCLEDYAFALPQKSRVSLLSDIIAGMICLWNNNIFCPYGNKTAIMISDEGRAVIAFFRSEYLYATKPDSSVHQARFKPPGLRNISNSVWVFGCLCYLILSRREPYYQYTEVSEILSAVSRGELPIRPDHSDDAVDEIDDRAWGLITKCCKLERGDRPTAAEVQNLIAGWEVDDIQSEGVNSLGGEFLATRSAPDMDFHHVEALIDTIQVELLREPLSELLRSHIKDIAAVVTTEFKREDISTLVNFLDLALRNHLSITEEQNRVLALLARITSSTHIFPQRYEIKGIKYDSKPIAGGGYGSVHRATDINACVKVMTQVDSKALTPWIKELILWAHLSHHNVLPFCGVLLENVNGTQRICLVSPFMKNGNLHVYAPRLPQRNRLPLILDIANGLHYLHSKGIIHSDLKGENILISNEERALLTDFGSTQITTSTKNMTASLIPTTLRFAAPEVMLNTGPPTKEGDIWSYGCVVYQTLSRLPPYYQYSRDIQISAALGRKEPLKRPATVSHIKGGDDTSDDSDCDDEDFDEIDHQGWKLITKCCSPEPQDRPKTSLILELIVDMKVWDERPAANFVLGAEISKLREDTEIDLNRVGKLLGELQTKFSPSEGVRDTSFIDVFYELLE